MNIEELESIIEGFAKYAAFHYMVSLVVIIIAVILLFITLRKIKRWNLVRVSSLLASLTFIVIALNMIINGVSIYRLANDLKRDSEMLQIEQTCGEVEEVYFKHKSRFIVINSESFLLRQDIVDTKAYTGEEYYVEYYANSKLIISLEELERN